MKPSTKRTLQFLRERPQGATTHECIEHLTHRFSARIADLRRHGYEIETRRHPGSSSCTYILKSSPTSPTASGSAAEREHEAPPSASGVEAHNPASAQPAVEPDTGSLFGIEPDLSQARSAALEDWDEAA